MTLPFDGLYTGPNRADRLASQRPPMSILTRSRAWSSGWVVTIGTVSVERDSSDILTSNRRRK